MTAEQFAQLMGVTLEELSKNNARVIAKAEKEKGMIVRKEGKGKKARYFIDSLEEVQSLFDNAEVETDFDKEFIKFKDLKFKTLLALTLKPEKTYFEGTLEEFGITIGVIDDKTATRAKSNWIKKIKDVLLELQKEEIIVAYYDKKQRGEVWVLFLRPSVKEDMIPINTSGIVFAKDLCEKGEINVRWENFLKVWLALKAFRIENKDKFNLCDVQIITALGKDTVSKVLMYMRENGMVAVQRNVVYLKDTNNFQILGLKAERHSFDFNLL